MKTKDERKAERDAWDAYLNGMTVTEEEIIKGHDTKGITRKQITDFFEQHPTMSNLAVLALARAAAKDNAITAQIYRNVLEAVLADRITAKMKANVRRANGFIAAWGLQHPDQYRETIKSCALS